MPPTKKSYEISFDYTGSAPTESRMKTIMDATDLSDRKMARLVVWTAKSVMDASGVENVVKHAVEEDGDWGNGHITDFTVETI